MQSSSSSSSISSSKQISTLLLLSTILIAPLNAAPFRLTRRCETSTINYTTGDCNPVQFGRMWSTGSSHPEFSTGGKLKASNLMKGVIKNESGCYSACVKSGVEFTSLQFNSLDSSCWCKLDLSSYDSLRTGGSINPLKGTVTLFAGTCESLSNKSALAGGECEDVTIKLGGELTLTRGGTPRALI